VTHLFELWLFIPKTLQNEWSQDSVAVK